MRVSVSFVCVLAMLGTFGCGGGGGDDTPPDTGPPMTDGGPPPVDSAPPPPRDSGPVGDGNDSFDTATVITDAPVNGIIETAGDLDYFQFEGTAGEWVYIATEANPDDEDTMVDTVVTLFDASMRQIAENDDSVQRVNTDSEIITRLPADGTYYVVVQEFSTWAGETDEFAPDFNYTLTVGPLDVAATGVNVDSEPGDTAGDAQTLAFDAGTTVDFALVAGDFTSTDALDVFGFSVVDANSAFSAVMMPVGPDGHGSTLTPAKIWVTNADGTETIAEIDPSQQDNPQAEFEIAPNLPAGDYRLWLSAPSGGASGANDFYVFKVYRYEDNPLEGTDTDATNGDPTTPDALGVTDDMGTDRGFILATLGDDDTDHFSFVASAGDEVSVYCVSRAAGSGVMGLTATLLNADGTPLSPAISASETAAEGAFLEDIAVPGAGTYLLRLTKTSQSATVTGNWVRCGVAVGPPAAG